MKVILENKPMRVDQARSTMTQGAAARAGQGQGGTPQRHQHRQWICFMFWCESYLHVLISRVFTTRLGADE